MFAFLRPPAWIVVAATADAAGACADLHASAFARAWTQEEFEALLSERAVAADLLIDGRRRGAGPAGFVLSRFAAGEAEVCSVAVDPGRRRLGGGAMLLEAHLRHLASCGVRRVTLDVDQSNAPARRLYARFGFEEVGRRAGYYRGAPPGAGTALVLARSIELAPRLHPEASVT